MKSQSIKLNRSLSVVETWTFGLTGHVGWIGTVPAIHAALGAKALWIWIPGVIVSMMLNLQVRALGDRSPDVSGGTPNYAARLLKKLPGLERYVALGYFIGWAAVPAVYAIILTDLIKTILEPFEVSLPEMWLKLAFTVIPFIVGLRGAKALSILHLFFAIPAIIFAIAYAIQGVGYLAFSPLSPGLLPTDLSPPNFLDWLKWFFIATYSVYSCETASSFVADSRSPQQTLKFLNFTAWLIPIVFIGGSMVLTSLATNSVYGDNVYLNLSEAGGFFWGSSASFFVTLLISFSCLLSSATAISNAPRILYQLSLDGYLAPVFSVVSSKGSLKPALLLSLILSLFSLAWGNAGRIVLVTGTGYLLSIVGFHLGIWLCRGQKGIRFAYWSGAFFLVELIVLFVGGFAWNRIDLVMGLLLPGIILGVDKVIRHVSFPPFHPEWWLKVENKKSTNNINDYVSVQIITLLFFICGTTIISWYLSGALYKTTSTPKIDILAVLLITLSFVCVAIACWTSLPQVTAIVEAREAAFQSQEILVLQAEKLEERKIELENALGNLQKAQAQLVQNEKIASLGQLVTGITFEITTLTDSIYGNLNYLRNSLVNILELLHLYRIFFPSAVPEIESKAHEIDIEFLSTSIFDLVDFTQLGAKEIQNLVSSLKTFSSSETTAVKIVDIHEGINLTLMILKHRMKNISGNEEIKVTKKYGKLIDLECFPGLLNQVFMNILTYSIDTLEEMLSYNQADRKPQIRISTQMIKFDWIRIEISDNSFGLTEEMQQQLFEPLSISQISDKTSRLGLLTSYEIITQKHGGKLKAVSSPGKGITFVIDIPVYRA